MLVVHGDRDEPRVAVRDSAKHIATHEIRGIAPGSLRAARSMYGPLSFRSKCNQWVMSARNRSDSDERLRFRGHRVENRNGAVRALGRDAGPHRAAKSPPKETRSAPPFRPAVRPYFAVRGSPPW